MSTDYIAKIYGEETDEKGWEKYIEYDGNIFKNISDLDDPIRILNKNKLPLSLVSNAEVYTEWESIGTFKKSDISTLSNKFNLNLQSLDLFDPNFEHHTSPNCYALCQLKSDNTLGGMVVQNLDDFKELKEYEVEIVTDLDEKRINKSAHPNKTYININNWITEKDNENYVELYVKVAFNHNGNFYDIKSFYEKVKSLKSEYDTLLRQVIKMEDIKNSIEYFKLSEEGMFNFNEALESKNEMLNYLESCINTCNEFISHMELFTGIYDEDGNYISRDVILYLYSEC